MNPAVVAPDGFDIVDISAGVTLHPDHRRSLGSIAKVLQHAAARKAFDGENAHLCGVNRYLEDTYHKFRWALGWHWAGRAAGGRWKGLGLTAEVLPPRRFIAAACCVPEPEERFNVDEYSEMVAVAKPVIYITVGELINTHKVIKPTAETQGPSPLLSPPGLPAVFHHLLCTTSTALSWPFLPFKQGNNLDPAGSPLLVLL